MKTPSALTLLALLLATTCQAQTVIFQESFDSGETPLGWSKRFGTVKEVDTGYAWGFNNRRSGDDTFSAPMDLSGGGQITLSFDFRSTAIQNHSLIVGLKVGDNPIQWLYGSPFLASAWPFIGVLEGSEGWSSHSYEIGAYLGSYATSDLTGVRLAFLSSNMAGLSSDAVWLDSVRVQLVQAQAFSYSAVPESGCFSCILGAVVAFLALLWKRRVA